MYSYKYVIYHVSLSYRKVFGTGTMRSGFSLRKPGRLKLRVRSVGRAMVGVESVRSL